MQKKRGLFGLYLIKINTQKLLLHNYRTIVKG